jgi:lipopolysaccharide export LptBFGC system permease protein LptF
LLTAEMDLDDLVSRFGRGGFEDSRSISELRGSLFDNNLNYNEKRRAIVLFHRKLAEAVANFTLLLVALPLSILYGRSRSVGFGLSLVLIISWYLLLTLGQLLSQTGVLPVWVGLWFGNTVLGGIGLYLLGTRFSFR